MFAYTNVMATQIFKRNSFCLLNFNADSLNDYQNFSNKITLIRFKLALSYLPLILSLFFSTLILQAKQKQTLRDKNFVNYFFAGKIWDCNLC
jgi:hypothetical protein